MYLTQSGLESLGFFLHRLLQNIKFMVILCTLYIRNIFFGGITKVFYCGIWKLVGMIIMQEDGTLISFGLLLQCYIYLARGSNWSPALWCRNKMVMLLSSQKNVPNLHQTKIHIFGNEISVNICLSILLPCRRYYNSRVQFFKLNIWVGFNSNLAQILPIFDSKLRF